MEDKLMQNLNEEELDQVSGGVGIITLKGATDVCPKCHSTDLVKFECDSYVQFTCNQCQHRMRIPKNVGGTGTGMECSGRY